MTWEMNVSPRRNEPEWVLGPKGDQTAAFGTTAVEGISTGLDEDVEELLRELRHNLTGPFSSRAPANAPDISARRSREASEPLGWVDLMPSPGSDWQHERRRQNALIAQMPHRLQRLVRGSRRTHLRQTLLDLIDLEVRRMAAKEDRLLEHEKQLYEPSVNLRRYWAGLAEDTCFMNRLFRRSREVVAQASYNRAWFHSSGVERFSSLGKLPAEGTVEALSWIGLTAKPLPHRAPEGLLVWLAQLLWARRGSVSRRQLRVLDWGAGNSPFARALGMTNPGAIPDVPNSMTFDEAYGPEDASKVHGERRWELDVRLPQPTILVDEVELMGEPSDVSMVRYRGTCPPSSSYDEILVQLPPPCIGRGGYRDWHKDRGVTEVRSAPQSDLGRLGPRRWRASVRRLLPDIIGSLAPRGYLRVLIPLFCVGDEKPLDPVVLIQAILEDAGLRLVSQIVVTQDEVAETWAVLGADWEGHPPLVREDDEMDSLLEELDDGEA